VSPANPSPADPNQQRRQPPPTITRLPRNGPRPGQSTSAWLYGKRRATERLLDNPRTKLRGLLRGR
jgi:hypothetical protein